MGGFRFLYRLMGSIWSTLGVGAVVISAILLVTKWALSIFEIAVDQHNTVVLPAILGLVFGGFCIYYGSQLIALKNWTRSAGISFHITMGVVLLVLAIAGYAWMRAPESARVIRNLAIVELLVGILLSGSLVLLGLQLSSRQAVDIFTGESAQELPPQVVECPTCNQPMDVVSEKCPNCDRPPEELPAIVRATLIDLQNGREHPILLRKLTRIGRENPELEVQFDDQTVGSNHAVIEFIDGVFFLHALVDINGTFVNETRIRDSLIQNNDVLRFGRAQAKFMTFSEEPRG